MAEFTIHRIQLPNAMIVETGQIRTVSGNPNGEPACAAATTKFLEVPLELPTKTSMAKDIAPNSGVKITIAPHFSRFILRAFSLMCHAQREAPDKTGNAMSHRTHGQSMVWLQKSIADTNPVANPTTATPVMSETINREFMGLSISAHPLSNSANISLRGMRIGVPGTVSSPDCSSSSDEPVYR